MQELEMLTVVALIESNDQHGLVRGQVGTVVERLAPAVYEVEFSDDDGRTYASLPLAVEQLLVLRRGRIDRAA